MFSILPTVELKNQLNFVSGAVYKFLTEKLGDA